MPETEARDDFLPASMDDLRGRTPDELRKLFEVVDAHLQSLHQGDDGELRDLDDAERAAFDFGLQVREEIMRKLEEHRRIADVFARRPERVQQVYSNIRYGLDDPAGDTRRMTNSEARDRSLRVLDSRDANDLSPSAKDQVERMLRRDTVIARRILVTENEDYRTGWMKMVTQVHPILTAEEQRAMLAWEEYRAMGDWTTTAGGFGIPVKLAA